MKIKHGTVPSSEAQGECFVVGVYLQYLTEMLSIGRTSTDMIEWSI
jgi:hypothetical protein